MFHIVLVKRWRKNIITTMLLTAKLSPARKDKQKVCSRRNASHQYSGCPLFESWWVTRYFVPTSKFLISMWSQALLFFSILFPINYSLIFPQVMLWELGTKLLPATKIRHAQKLIGQIKFIIHYLFDLCVVKCSHRGKEEWYRFIRNDCRGFNNLSYTIHLR